MSKPGLARIALLRHGQSTGNVAREAAEADGSLVIDIAERDADVPLSPLGEQQARAASGWFQRYRPDVTVASTYRRAIDTGRLAGGESAEIVVDERLRDRELGVLDLFTSRGVRERWPDELKRQQRLGKFYYRPPGGESWADVVQRLRLLLAELAAEAPECSVLLVGHEVTVFALRYLLERVAEPELMRAASRSAVANGSVTVWERRTDGTFEMTTAQDTSHVASHPAATSTADEDAAAPLS